jgi:2-acylglycerol O-acyltransferase 2
VSVIGRPIAVVQNPHPTQDYILEIQKKYIDELVRIWEKYKDLYAQNRSRELTLIE